MIERPFQHLKRISDGKYFEPQIVKVWYEARAYVRHELRDTAFVPGSTDFLHAVVEGDSMQMLAVARQIALSAHFINFDESNPDESLRNRSVITIVSSDPSIRDILQLEEYMGNLPKFCKFVDSDGIVSNADSYVDIEIHVVADRSKVREVGTTVYFSDSGYVDFCDSAKTRGVDIYSVDTSLACYTNRIFNLGAAIDNLPDEDIHSCRRYSMAMDVYQYGKLLDEPEPIMNPDGNDGVISVRETLSNIFCSDSFETRYLSVSRIGGSADPSIWAEYNECMSVSEHARWVTEKLVMGYSPLDYRQRYNDECLYYDSAARAAFRKKLKKNPVAPAHIDICSYRDLRRINPSDMKYDSFLMLAVPMILAVDGKLHNK